ncbi:hypothetical protein PIB30_021397 [Stylosanthes scabra]|uniref:Uncharacterized protein n=1 Tax=Stylosanthes scabra TaxID=79078 RepID=A0ABU6T9J7_9FABA|nr:hypothetical protein [Stylosanthes scabra]
MVTFAGTTTMMVAVVAAIIEKKKEEEEDEKLSCREKRLFTFFNFLWVRRTPTGGVRSVRRQGKGRRRGRRSRHRGLVARRKTATQRTGSAEETGQTLAGSEEGTAKNGDGGRGWDEIQ